MSAKTEKPNQERTDTSHKPDTETDRALEGKDSVLIVLSDDGYIDQDEGIYDQIHVYGNFWTGPTGDNIRSSNISYLNSDLDRMRKVWGEKSDVELEIGDFEEEYLPEIEDVETYEDESTYLDELIAIADEVYEV